jgi:glyoxylase-like metal-dependent hydrolase (beta-lactamase superfamily II)
MRINPYLYCVGGGDYGFNLSGRLDCNSYVIDVGDELWMIDAGFDGGPDVRDNMVHEGIDPRRITRLFVTHYHADHAGALAYMRQTLSPQLRIAIAAQVADVVRAGDEEPTGLAWAKSFGFYPDSFTWEPCEIDDEIVDGDVVTSGEFSITAIDTPGHCAGHTCYLLRAPDRSYLFTGDHVFWGGKIILQNVADSSVQEYARSMNRLLEFDFDALMPGHLNFSLSNGKKHVAFAADQFNRIGLPPSML